MDALCKAEAEGRFPAATNTINRHMMSVTQASSSGTALFPERILRCCLVDTRLYYTTFAETRLGC